jgi:hypothetical protein
MDREAEVNRLLSQVKDGGLLEVFTGSHGISDKNDWRAPGFLHRFIGLEHYIEATHNCFAVPVKHAIEVAEEQGKSDPEIYLLEQRLGKVESLYHGFKELAKLVGKSHEASGDLLAKLSSHSEDYLELIQVKRVSVLDDAYTRLNQYKHVVDLFVALSQVANGSRLNVDSTIAGLIGRFNEVVVDGLELSNKLGAFGFVQNAVEYLLDHAESGKLECCSLDAVVQTKRLFARLYDGSRELYGAEKKLRDRITAVEKKLSYRRVN